MTKLAATARTARTADLVAEWGLNEAPTDYEVREAHVAAYFAAEADRAEYSAAHPVANGEYTWAEYLRIVSPMWDMVPENYLPEGMEFYPELLASVLWKEYGIWWEAE